MNKTLQMDPNVSCSDNSAKEYSAKQGYSSFSIGHWPGNFKCSRKFHRQKRFNYTTWFKVHPDMYVYVCMYVCVCVCVCLFIKKLKLLLLQKPHMLTMVNDAKIQNNKYN